MIRLKFLFGWTLAIFSSIGIVLTLIFSVSFISTIDNEVIVATSWNRSGAQYASLQKIVHQFNLKNPSTYPLVLKQMDPNKVTATVGTGKLGLRKLPNLIISYGDAILKYDQLLQQNATGAFIEDLTPYVFQTNNHQIIPEFLRETTHQNKLIVAPIGKSIDYMFVNKKLVAQIFQTLGLNNIARIIVDGEVTQPLIDMKDIDKMNVPSYSFLKTIQTKEAVIKMFNNWEQKIQFYQAAHFIFKKNGNKDKYLLGIDDPSSVAYAHYANAEAVNEHFIYSENPDENYTPTIKAANKSKEILNDFLTTMEKIKKLSPRTSSNPERINGVRVKMTNNDYNSSFFAKGNMIVTIGSTAGIGHVLRKNLRANDIWLLPVPGKERGKFIMQQGPGIGMFKLDDEIKNKRAQQFVNYLTSPDVNQIYAVEANYLPIHWSSYERDSLYFQNMQKLPPQQQDLIRQITQTLVAKDATYQSVPITYEGNNFRYSVFDASIKNFLLDVNQEGVFSKKGIDINDFWDILQSKAHSQFSNHFVWEKDENVKK